MTILPPKIWQSHVVPLAFSVVALALGYALSPRVPLPARSTETIGTAPKIAVAVPQDVAPQIAAVAPETAPSVVPPKDQSRIPLDDQSRVPLEDDTAAAAPDVKPEPDLSLLADYAYSEVPPDTPPAETIMNAFKDMPVGTPMEEIKRASEALGLDFTFMKAVARIESDFNPTARTGSYIGLFQLSHYEFARYGYWDIESPRDNAIAAAYKFTTAAILFEIRTHKKATLSDLYLIHQQGTQGAAEHVSHPERIAWESMCATDEGRMKGEKWCKRAIWQNTLPDVKKEWKKVENLTSAAFVKMWQDRVAEMYARYSEAVAVDAPALPGK